MHLCSDKTLKKKTQVKSIKRKSWKNSLFQSVFHKKKNFFKFNYITDRFVQAIT